MLCVNQYTKQHIRDCHLRFSEHVTAYQKLSTTASGWSAATPAKSVAVLKAFEAHYFNNLVLALDSHFTHRARGLEKKDGNPLNEVRMLCRSLTNHGGVMSPDSTIKYDPSKSVLKYLTGDKIELTESAFILLCEAFLSDIEAKFA